MIDHWHWDYEEGADPSYYHIYNDDGAVATFDIPESPPSSRLVKQLCDILPPSLQSIRSTND